MRLNGLSILTGSAFKKVKLSSCSFPSKSVVLLVADFANSTQHPYVGFIVSKKNGGAVKRNFLKRRLRAAAVKIIPKAAESGKAYVLIPRASLALCSFSQLEKDLCYCLKSSKKS